MIAVETGALARPLVTIATNDARVHSPADWARGTAKQLVSVDETIAPERLKAAFRLRGLMADTLHEGFSAIVLGMSENALDTLGNDTCERTLAHAVGTPWEQHFADPQTRTAMALCIWRNIHDAAHQAVTRE